MNPTQPSDYTGDVLDIREPGKTGASSPASSVAADSIRGKNRIRDAIMSFFPDRECYTLKRPVNDEGQLQHLAELTLEQMRPGIL